MSKKNKKNKKSMPEKGNFVINFVSNQSNKVLGVHTTTPASLPERIELVRSQAENCGIQIRVSIAKLDTTRENFSEYEFFETNRAQVKAAYSGNFEVWVLTETLKEAEFLREVSKAGKSLRLGDERELAIMTEAIELLKSGTLTKDRYSEVVAQLENVATLPFLSEEIVSIFAHELENQEISADAWRNILLNEDIATEILVGMAISDCWLLRNIPARNPNTPVELLRELAKDEAETVRWLVAQNSSAPEDSLRALANDPEEDIREEARRTLNCEFPDMDKKLTVVVGCETQELITENPNILSQLLEKLEEDMPLILEAVQACENSDESGFTIIKPKRQA